MSKEGNGEPPSTLKHRNSTLEFVVLKEEAHSVKKEEEERLPTLKRGTPLAEEFYTSGKKEEEEAPIRRERGSFITRISTIIVKAREEAAASDKLLTHEPEEPHIQGSLSFFVDVPTTSKEEDRTPHYRRAPSRTFYSADSISSQTPRGPAGRIRAHSDGDDPPSRG
jgi:hypothetical protein